MICPLAAQGRTLLDFCNYLHFWPHATSAGFLSRPALDLTLCRDQCALFVMVTAIGSLIVCLRGRATLHTASKIPGRLLRVTMDGHARPTFDNCRTPPRPAKSHVAKRLRHLVHRILSVSIPPVYGDVWRRFSLREGRENCSTQRRRASLDYPSARPRTYDHYG